MIHRLLIKLLVIALLLILNGVGTRPCNSTPEAWIQKKYRQYRADFHYLELFVKAYKQIDAS
jgi:hypothetical protein